MKLKKIENPWELAVLELEARCVLVEAGDRSRHKPVFFYNEFNHRAMRIHGFGCFAAEFPHYFWPLLGWTFYEAVEPLVWEGECGTGRDRVGLYVPVDKPLPEGFEFKRFRVVATEIVEGEDA